MISDHISLRPGGSQRVCIGIVLNDAGIDSIANRIDAAANQIASAADQMKASGERNDFSRGWTDVTKKGK